VVLSNLMLMVMLLVARAHPAAAQEAPTPEAQPERALRRSLDQPMFDAVLSMWKNCHHDFEARRYPDLLVDLGNLKALKAATGVPNLSPIARALLRLALQVAEDPDNAELAPKLAGHAQTMAPDLPATWLVTSQLSSGASGPVSPGDSLRAFFQWVGATRRHLPSLLQAVSKASFIWLLSTLLAATLFSVLLLVRYIKLLANDLWHVLPPGAAGWQKIVLGTLMLLVPFLLDLGVVILFLAWWLFFWVYMNRGERLAALLCLALLATWPFAGRMFAAGVTPPDAPELTIARCSYEVCSTEDVSRLEAWHASGVEDDRIPYTLALASWRRGAFDPLALDDVLVYLSRIRDDGDPETLVRARVLKANAFFAKGLARCAASRGDITAGAQEFQEADNLYRQSLDLRETVEGLYNRGRALAYRNQPGDGEQLIARARAMDTRRILDIEEVSQFSGQQEFLCGQHFNHNRELLVPLVPVDDLFLALVRAQPPDQLLGFHHQILGPLPLDRVPHIAGGSALVLLILGLALRSLRASGHCVRCGAVSDPKARPELAQSGICETCLFYRIRGSFVDPKEIWRRDKGIELGQRLRLRIERGLSFLLPGTGQMLRGRPVRGMLFFGLVFLPILGFVVSDPLMGNLPGIETSVGMPLVQIIAFGLVSLVGYLLTLLDIYSRD